jgi:hypothetical protein
MRLNIRESKFALTHPGAALSYLTRMGKIAKLVGCSTSEVKHVFNERGLTEVSEQVVNELGGNIQLIMGPSLRPRKAEVYYSIVRLSKHSVVVETGVQSGISSSFILQALEKNGEGKLYS